MRRGQALKVGLNCCASRGNKCKRWSLCWKSTRRWLRSYQHLLFSHDCNFPWDRWHEIWIERRLSVLTWPRAFASCYIFGFKENHFFFLLKKLSGQTLTSWVDRSGLAQYFRITKRGKSKHLLVGFHLFVNSKLLTRSQRSEAMSSFRILDILSFLLNVSKFQVNAYVMEQKLCNLQKQQGQLSWATGQILFVCGLDLLNNDGHWQSF